MNRRRPGRLFRSAAIMLGMLLLLSAKPGLAAETSLGVTVYESELAMISLGRLGVRQHIIYNEPIASIQSEKIVFYSANGDVTPMVYYGSKLYGRQTLSESAEQLYKSGLTPVAAINGDFFSLQTGLPLGIVIVDGKLKASCDAQAAVGFNADGTAFIGQPGFSSKILMAGAYFDLVGINKLRTQYGLYLQTNDFSAYTRNSAAGIDVILKPSETDIIIGRRITATVEEIRYSSSSEPIPEGRFVLTIDMRAPGDQLAAVQRLKAGSQVFISTEVQDKRFASALYAVGGGELLIKDGVAQTGLGSAAAPRSAIGVRADGSFLLYAVDGRSPGYSDGLSLDRLAGRLKELGCVSALNLDGGGSTAIALTYPGDNEMTVINRPSDGAERTCANYIFLVRPTLQNAPLSKLYLYPYDSMLLVGQSLQFKTVATDRFNNTAAAPEIYYSITSGGGKIDKNGLFTALEPGVVTITASGGGLSVSTEVTVFENVTDIKLYSKDNLYIPLSSITAEAGQVIGLTAIAKQGVLTPSGGNQCFKWEVNGAVGEIEKGVLKINENARGTGSLIVSYGNLSREIPIIVSTAPYALENFEKDSFKLSSSDTAVITRETESDKVSAGRGSARVDYTISDGKAVIYADMDIDPGTTNLSFWLYGNGGGNSLALQLTLANGERASVGEVNIDFTGWRYITLAIPDNTVKLTSIEIFDHYKTCPGGTLWFDRFVGAYTHIPDSAPPVIEFVSHVADGSGKVTVTAAVMDSDGSKLLSGDIGFSLDGKPIAFTYDEKSGMLLAEIFPSPGLHRVSIIAADQSGNYSKQSLDLYIDGENTDYQPFDDMKNYWAEQYTTYLYQQGIAHGELMDTGIRLYRPANGMTRIEFAVLIAKYLPVNTSLYAEVELPYLDASSIPEWALPSVKSLYAMGLMRGRGDLFEPYSNVTRTEVMVVIGRTLPQGFQGSMPDFSDLAEVAPADLRYVDALVSAGIINGYDDGTLKPGREITRAEAAKILYTLF